MRPHRQEVNDAPLSFRRNHMFGRRLSQKHRGFQVDLINLIEGFLRDLQHRLFDLQPRTIEQDIEAAKQLDNLVHRGPDFFNGRYVDAYTNGFETLRFQVRCQLFGFFQAAARYHDLGAVKAQGPGAGLANAAITTRHVNDLAG